MSNYFVTPADPEGFAVNLPQRSDRVIDFTALEFDTLMKVITEYVRTYYRDQFNDFVVNNGFMMISEVVSYVGSVLAQREDILANNGFLGTSTSPVAVTNHLNLVGQTMQRQTPATTQIMCSVGSPVSTNIEIPAGTIFNLKGPDNQALTYELFAAPYDWNSPIILPANKFAIIGWAIEGKFANTYTATMTGGASQLVTIQDTNILDDPIIVTIDNQSWVRVAHIENYGPNDLVYEVDIVDTSLTIKFGDNVNGKAPLDGQQLSVRYRIGGGVRGRIGAGVINSTINISPTYPVTASVPVTFINPTPSSGGYDAETIDDAKKRAPKQWATHENITTADDYVNTASSFKHPVYGGIAKAVATVYTSINANLVKVFVLAEGANGTPVQANNGLKNGLKNSLNQLNVLTDDVEVDDGVIKAVNVELVVGMYKNADAGSVKEQVNSSIDSFFDLSKWNMGQPLYVSALYDTIMSINGVKFVNIFSPSDDLLPATDIGSGAANAVQFNELITLGNKNVRIYYEK
jgi:hypothetical protein